MRPCESQSQHECDRPCTYACFQEDIVPYNVALHVQLLAFVQAAVILLLLLQLLEDEVTLVHDALKQADELQAFQTLEAIDLFLEDEDGMTWTGKGIATDRSLQETQGKNGSRCQVPACVCSAWAGPQSKQLCKGACPPEHNIYRSIDHDRTGLTHNPPWYLHAKHEKHAIVLSLLFLTNVTNAQNLRTGVEDGARTSMVHLLYAAWVTAVQRLMKLPVEKRPENLK
eukprot:1160218-Pelagomonas_calceolata.AAC.19